MAERALTFGSVAEGYERYRPGYPDDLVDAVLAYAARPVVTALEIGAGTGKATRVFASRGIAVTATEPDPEMLAELRRHVPASVTTLQRSLETLPDDGPFDLVYAAASLHWTTPDTRWPLIAALLPVGGVFASLGGPTRLADPELCARVAEARRPFVDDEISAPEVTDPKTGLEWPGTELARSPLFTDVSQTVVDRRDRVDADDYLGLLTTVSAYLLLPGPTLQQALTAIRAVLPDRVEVDSSFALHLARRTGVEP